MYHFFDTVLRGRRGRIVDHNFQTSSKYFGRWVSGTDINDFLNFLKKIGYDPANGGTQLTLSYGDDLNTQRMIRDAGHIAGEFRWFTPKEELGTRLILHPGDNEKITALIELFVI